MASYQLFIASESHYMLLTTLNNWTV